MSEPLTTVKGNALIRLRGVTRTYGRGETLVRALAGVDLDIAAGEFVAVMGPSGSGKSTLMNILGCLDTPTGGEYIFRGVNVEKLDRDQRARLRRQHIGFVFQGFNLLARTTAQENVELPLLYRGETAAERHRQAAAALASVGLEGREDHTPAELSGGQQQRVAIARAIVTHRRCSLPTSRRATSIPVARARSWITSWASTSAPASPILMVTHDPSIASYASRIVHVVDGRIQRDERNVRRSEDWARPESEALA